MIFRRISAMIATLTLIFGILACSLASGAGSGTAISITPSPVAEDLCANPLMPVVPGALWFYSVSGGPDGKFAYSSAIRNTSEQGFEEDAIFSTITKNTPWQCTPEGLVALMPGGGSSANVHANSAGAEFETTGAAGVTLPRSVSEGDQWQQTLKLHGTHTNSDGSISTSDGTYVTSFNATGMQSVSVPAGTFMAMRIDWVIDMNLTATVSGVGVPVHTGFSGVDWYAPGIGLVKEIVEGDNGGTTELSSYTIPPR